VLTACKILGLTTLIVAGLAGQGTEPIEWTPNKPDLSLAMIFVLFAFSGWNEMGCVAAEVRDPRRNLLRALMIAAGIVSFVYLGLNAACWKLLGLEGMASAPVAPAEAAKRAFGPWGARALGVLICVSALNSTNGMVFTGARIYYAMGKRQRLFAPLAVWSRRFGTPLVSLAVQTAVTLALLVGFGGLGDGGEPREAFTRLVIFMTPPFYVFLFLSALAVIVLRRRSTTTDEAVYRLPLFPLPPLIIAAASVFMTYQGANYLAFNFSQQGAMLVWPTVWVGATFATGVLFAFVDKRSD
jgi:amino acid transporter